LKKNKLKRPDSDKPNPLIPHMYRLPYSQEEFDNKNLSGNFDELSEIFQPGELVTYISQGPVYKPAKLLRLGKDRKADIEFSEFDENDGSTKIISATVSGEEYEGYQLAGPSIFIDKKIQVPKSIHTSTYDQELYFYLATQDLEPF